MTLTQGLPDWISSHVRAFSFFGGVARQTVSDNLKAGVTRACFHERFAARRVQGLLHALLLFVLVQGTFAHRHLREHLAPLLGLKPGQLTAGKITYDLPRLRLHGLIERIPKTHRYLITDKGLRTAIFYTRLYNRSLRTGLAVVAPAAINPESPIAKSICAAECAVNAWYDNQKLAA